MGDQNILKSRVNPPLTPQLAIGRQRAPRLIAGLALSLLVHGAALVAWRHQPPVQRRAEAPAPASIAVWLRAPPAPKAPTAPTAPTVRTSVPAAKPSPVAAAKPRRRAPTNLIALPAAPLPTRPDAFTVEPSPAPRFDPEAARRMARAMASEPDPAKAGTALAQLPPKPLETETRAARAISGAKRGDCKDGIPGGLLAPLFLMMDKKDSGCKW